PALAGDKSIPRSICARTVCGAMGRSKSMNAVQLSRSGRLDDSLSGRVVSKKYFALTRLRRLIHPARVRSFFFECTAVASCINQELHHVVSAGKAHELHGFRRKSESVGQGYGPDPQRSR